MKYFFTLFVFFAIIHFCYPQFTEQYSYTIEKGKDPYMYYFRGLAQHIVQGPVDDVLTDVQTIPFEWDFFGEKVNQYFISDNGYITFDMNVTESLATPQIISEETSPKGSIFGFWFDIGLGDYTPWSNEIAVSTVGTSPDRVHIIYWMRVVPKVTLLTDENISFFIALHEQGGFDIGYTVMGVYLDIKGTVGAISLDGNQIVNIEPSPEYPFPSCGYGDSDDECILVRENVINVEENFPCSFKIYPNPVSDYIEIIAEARYAVSLNSEIQIFNSLGESLMKSFFSSPTGEGQELRFDISGLPPGIFFLRFSNKFYKFVKI
ncbi:MAG: T9SS type A sorting domain-containing protein [bacterium]